MQIFSTSQKGRSKFNIEKEVQVIYSYVIHTFFLFFRVWFLQLIYFEYVDPWMLCDNETSFNLNILSILGIPFSYFEIEHNVWSEKNQKKEWRYFVCLFLYSSVKSIQFTIFIWYNIIRMNNKTKFLSFNIKIQNALSISCTVATMLFVQWLASNVFVIGMLIPISHFCFIDKRCQNISR